MGNREGGPDYLSFGEVKQIRQMLVAYETIEFTSAVWRK